MRTARVSEPNSDDDVTSRSAVVAKKGAIGKRARPRVRGRRGAAAAPRSRIGESAKRRVIDPADEGQCSDTTELHSPLLCIIGLTRNVPVR